MLSFIYLAIDYCNQTLDYETENLFCNGAKCSRNSTIKPEEKYNRNVANLAFCTDCFKILKLKINLTPGINNESKPESVVFCKFGKRSNKICEFLNKRITFGQFINEKNTNYECTNCSGGRNTMDKVKKLFFY